ncbi:hypothetical protein EOS_35715 [Caballeronia mineralivorans PML1(12)]|uniref:Uncharacterized protein n=1 Tax=Caballeronia mineralivorans PML1(12) TaxID=908627 RepID=A0A0J1CM72_9BURK|nr:hypothetical protein EOS_35715 [Caballeronia mineralivorans PML1(12)]
MQARMLIQIKNLVVTVRRCHISIMKRHKKCDMGLFPPSMFFIGWRTCGQISATVRSERNVLVLGEIRNIEADIW